jgi:hypothetical protein
MSAMGLPPLPEGATWGDDPTAKPAASLPPLPKGATFAEAPAEAAPSLTQRFFANLAHEATGGTNQAVLRNQEDTMLRTLRAQGQPEAAARYEANRAQSDRAAAVEYENLPGWHQNSLMDLPQGLAALAGTVIGDVSNAPTNPTKVITEIPFLGPLASRIFGNVAGRAAPVISKAVPGVVQRTLAAGGHQAVAALAADPYEQALKIGSGMQKEYNPQQTLMAPATGFAVGSTLHGGSELFSRLVNGRTVPNAANVNEAAVEPPPPAAPQPLALAPPPGGLSDWQVRRAQENVNNPRGNPNTAPDERFTVPPERQPQTIDQAIQQRQAQDAFDLAQRQRERITPTTVDVQTAGRPEGVQPQDIILNEGFPVQELSRAQVNVNGKPVTMVKVQRYDPRTGAAVEGAQPYEVPAHQLQTASYSVEPRAAQEFVRRAEGPPAPEQPRAPTEGVTREAAQTFRATEPDPNTQFPGAKPGLEGRGPIPPQPEGPHPGPERPFAEEDYIRDFGQRREAGQSSGRAYRAGDENASTKAASPGTDSRYGVDDRGFVNSDKGGPVKFADQKQAAKWILNEGHKKSPDQIFEIENHPSGQGFTVRERGRTQAQPKGEVVPAGGPDGAGSKSGGATARGEGDGLPPGKPSPAPERESLRSAHEDVAAVRNPQPQGPKPKPPVRETLFQAIKRLGGIKDTGEVRAVMTDYPGNRGKNQFMSAKGRDPDKIREALQQEGWFGSTKGHDIQDLYDAIGKEAQKVNGEGFVHPDDVQAVADHKAAAEAHSIGTAHIDAEMSRAGVTPEDTDAQAAAKLADYRDAEQAAFDAHLEEIGVDDGDLSDQLSGASLSDLRNYDYEDSYEPGADQGAEFEAQPDEAAARASGETGDAGMGAKEPDGTANRAGQTADEPGGQEHAGTDDREAKSADRPDTESSERDAGGGQEREAGQEEPRRRAEPEQTRVEGTEEASAEEMKRRADQRRAQEKQQNPRAHNDKAQKKADEGLFADQSEKNQTDMFAGEPKAAEKTAAASDLKNKFYSNPVTDPEIWREAARTMADVFGWGVQEAKYWGRNIHDSAVLLQKDIADGKIGSVTKGLGQHFNSSDGQLRSVGATAKSKIPSRIADMFFVRGGKLRDGAVGEDYYQAINAKNREWGNRITKVMKPFSKLTREERENLGKQITKLVQNPDGIKAKLGTPVGDAAAEITKTLAEIHEYLVKSGVAIGKVEKGFWPRVQNTASIFKDNAGFVRQATKAYVAKGLKQADAEASAQALLTKIQGGDWGGSRAGGDASMFTESRSWPKEADDIMRDFLEQHPSDVLSGYIRQATKKAEWSRRMGARDPSTKVPDGVDPTDWYTNPQGKWDDIMEELKAEGNASLIPTVTDLVQAITGDFASAGHAGGAQKVAQLSRTYVALTHMSKAVVTSLAEPVINAVQTGNTLDIARAYGETVRQWVPILRKIGDGQHLRDLAEDFGFVGDGIDSSTMMDRMGGANESAFLRKVTDNYFRKTGLTQFTEATRVASLRIGMRYMRALAKNVANDDVFAGIARKLLADSGIGKETIKGGKSADPVKDFAKWLTDLDKGATSKDIRAHDEFGRLYEVAIGRFVNRSVMQPTGALKPYLANKHPLAALVYALQSYNQAMTKNVLHRVGNMTFREALNPYSGLNVIERGYAAMPLVNLMALSLVQYGIGEMRDAVLADPARKGDPKMSAWKKIGRAASRSSFTGNFDPLFNFATGSKWQGTLIDAVAGPVAGDIAKLADDARAAGQPGQETNAAKRKTAADAYNLVLQPAMMAVMGAAAPTVGITGQIVGSAAAYAASDPRMREAVVRKVAGPKQFH